MRSRGVHLLLVHVFWLAVAIDRLDRRLPPLQCGHSDDEDKPAGQLLDWSAAINADRFIQSLCAKDHSASEKSHYMEDFRCLPYLHKTGTGVCSGSQRPLPTFAVAVKHCCIF